MTERLSRQPLLSLTWSNMARLGKLDKIAEAAKKRATDPKKTALCAIR